MNDSHVSILSVVSIKNQTISYPFTLTLTSAPHNVRKDVDGDGMRNSDKLQLSSVLSSVLRCRQFSLVSPALPLAASGAMTVPARPSFSCLFLSPSPLLQPLPR